MKSADQWLSEYSETHQNPLNKRIHLVCVPLIFWSIIALLVSLALQGRGPQVLVSFLLVPPLVFYFRLGWRYGFVMLGMTLLSFSIAAGLLFMQLPLAGIALGVFLLAWIGQFYGHKVEGKKPSFFQDLLYLLIGPLWTLQPLIDRNNRRPYQS